MEDKHTVYTTEKAACLILGNIDFDNRKYVVVTK